jgi:hypothetical protein
MNEGRKSGFPESEELPVGRRRKVFLFIEGEWQHSTSPFPESLLFFED